MNGRDDHAEIGFARGFLEGVPYPVDMAKFEQMPW
jgi:hypothetical protein